MAAGGAGAGGGGQGGKGRGKGGRRGLLGRVGEEGSGLEEEEDGEDGEGGGGGLGPLGLGNVHIPLPDIIPGVVGQGLNVGVNAALTAVQLPIHMVRASRGQGILPAARGGKAAHGAMTQRLGLTMQRPLGEAAAGSGTRSCAACSQCVQVVQATALIPWITTHVSGALTSTLPLHPSLLFSGGGRGAAAGQGPPGKCFLSARLGVGGLLLASPLGSPGCAAHCSLSAQHSGSNTTQAGERGLLHDGWRQALLCVCRRGCWGAAWHQRDCAGHQVGAGVALPHGGGRGEGFPLCAKATRVPTRFRFVLEARGACGCPRAGSACRCTRCHALGCTRRLHVPVTRAHTLRAAAGVRAACGRHVWDTGEDGGHGRQARAAPAAGELREQRGV